VSIRVVLEVAPKRAFASALDWPGWSRGGRDAGAAQEALVAYAPRYATVARRAKIAFPASVDAGELEVVHRVKGGSGTEFGVPGTAAPSEKQPLVGDELERHVSLLRASWAALDAAARKAVGVELRKGPRGGGRDLDKIIGHVREADVAYLGQLGSKAPSEKDEAPERPMKLLQAAFLQAITAAAEGRPFDIPRNTRKPWSLRYTIRRTAWHVLDHTWEIEDRAS
jgi:hypothetical protein